MIKYQFQVLNEAPFLSLNLIYKQYLSNKGPLDTEDSYPSPSRRPSSTHLFKRDQPHLGSLLPDSRPCWLAFLWHLTCRRRPSLSSSPSPRPQDQPAPDISWKWRPSLPHSRCEWCSWWRNLFVSLEATNAFALLLGTLNKVQEKPIRFPHVE